MDKEPPRNSFAMTGVTVIDTTSKPINNVTGQFVLPEGNKWAGRAWSPSATAVTARAGINNNGDKKIGLQGYKKNKVLPVSERIHWTFLEMEPLCCLSSSVVTTGCGAVVGFELFFVALTVLAIFLRINDSNYNFWPPFALGFQSLVTHHLVLYLVIVFDLVIIGMAVIMTKGLLNFDKRFMTIHWWFQFPAIAVCVLGLVAFVWGAVNGPADWDAPNILFVIAFAYLIPVEIWAIIIVKDCKDFFNLCQFFIQVADR